MIRLSTRGRYALRAMVDLAQYGDGGPIPRQQIAERQEISADYVTQLFRRLQSAMATIQKLIGGVPPACALAGLSGV